MKVSQKSGMQANVGIPGASTMSASHANYKLAESAGIPNPLTQPGTARAAGLSPRPDTPDSLVSRRSTPEILVPRRSTPDIVPK
jgi:hypothetical protein